jgi:hypothetical protein
MNVMHCQPLTSLAELITITLNGISIARIAPTVTNALYQLLVSKDKAGSQI